MGFLVYCIMTGLLLDSLIEAKKGPIKASRRGNKPANVEQHLINQKREDVQDLKTVHSIAWDVKTRAVEEIKYTEI